MPPRAPLQHYSDGKEQLLKAFFLLLLPKHATKTLLLRNGTAEICATRWKMGDLEVLTAILMGTQVYLDFTPYLLSFTDVSEKHNVYLAETSVNIHRLTRHNVQEDK